MVEAARILTDTPAPALQMSASPIVHSINGFQNARAIFSLFVLTGSYGVTGGICPPGKSLATLKGTYASTSEEAISGHDHGLSSGIYPLWDQLVHETQVIHMADYLSGKGAYPIRLLLGFGMNHHMWPRPDEIEQALQEENVEFFACADAFMTDTCKYADLVLPIALPPELEQVYIFPGDIVRYQPPLITPEGDIKNDMEIILELARRLRISIGNPSIQTYDDYLRMQLEPTGLKLEELKQHSDGLKSKQFTSETTSASILSNIQTPSGRLEFASEALKTGVDSSCESLPVYHDYRELLPIREYPLILSTGNRKPQFFHSRTYRLPWLAKLESCCSVDMHPDDARKLDLSDGDAALLSTPIGSKEYFIRHNTSCLPGVVTIYHGAGATDINYLVDDQYLDPISGFPGYKSYCCKIEKIY